MSAHTNVQIPRRWDHIDKQLYLTKVEAERKFWQETAGALLSELENLPEAIKRHGYVTLPDGTKLVPAAAETEQAD